MHAAYQFGLRVNVMVISDEDVDHVREGWQCDSFLHLILLK